MAGILNIQLNPETGQKIANLEKIEQYISQCLEKLDLVIMPEFFSTGISHKHFKNEPEDENGGKTVQFLGDLAKKYNTNIIAGTVIEKNGDKYYNTSFALNRRGEIIGKYRKIHLFNYMGGNEGELITPGDKEFVIDMDFAKVGMAVCFDIRYPMHFKKLAKMGAEIIVLPAAWVLPSEVFSSEETLQYASDMWRGMIRTRAYDNGVFMVVSDLTGVSGTRGLLGHSMIVSPTAEILAIAGTEENAIYADIDVDTVKYLKQIFPVGSID